MKPLTFCAPDPDASASGGNIFNRGLFAALRRAGAEVRVVGPSDPLGDGPRFVDSLFLGELPRLAPCHLLAHYLPALVEGRSSLDAVERAALLAADGFVVPSPYMHYTLDRLAPQPRPAVVIAPAVVLDPRVAASPERLPGAIVVANVIPAKGILELLTGIAARRGRLALTVIGSTSIAPQYLAACQLAAPWVRFLGERSHQETLRLVAGADFFVSASRMESFGIALAEARSLGVPIVARDGGNVSAHVDEESGGELVSSDDALAEACIRLAGNTQELARRQRAARAHRTKLPARTWDDAAAEFLRAFRG